MYGSRPVSARPEPGPGTPVRETARGVEIIHGNDAKICKVQHSAVTYPVFAARSMMKLFRDRHEQYIDAATRRVQERDTDDTESTSTATLAQSTPQHQDQGQRIFRRKHNALQLFRYDWIAEQAAVGKLSLYGGAITEEAWAACVLAFKEW